jgi:hypothetical protein
MHCKSLVTNQRKKNSLYEIVQLTIGSRDGCWPHAVCKEAQKILSAKNLSRMQAPEQWAWSSYCSYAYEASMEAGNFTKNEPGGESGAGCDLQDVVPAEIARLMGGA